MSQAQLEPLGREILELCADGLTDEAIARRLRLTESNVKGCLRKTFEWLGVSNRTQAVVWALQRGEITPPYLGERSGDEITRREREVLALLACGDSNKVISAKLYISMETVKSHLRHLFQKLDARHRTHAVAIGLTLGLIDPDPSAP